MEKEENGKQSGRTDELLEKLREQGRQIIEAVADNDDEMCALVIVGTKDKALCMVRSKPTIQIATAMANAAARDRNLLSAMYFAVKEAWDYIDPLVGSPVGEGDAEKK